MKKILLIALTAIGLLFSQVSAGSFKTTVTTAGTAVHLSTNPLVVRSATIQALSTNTGTVCFGGSNVLASTRIGTCLTAGLAGPLLNMPGFPFDLSSIYLDSTVNGEGVSVTYYQ